MPDKKLIPNAILFTANNRKLVATLSLVLEFSLVPSIDYLPEWYKTRYINTRI